MDLLSFSAMLSAFSVMDYLDDRERLKQERLHEYRVCYENLGDDVAAMSGHILDTLEKSGRYDLEDVIIKGTKQFPLRIFKDVLKLQGKPVSRYQNGLIDIYFRHIEGVGYDKEAFFRSVYDNEVPEEELCAPGDEPSPYAEGLSDLLATAGPDEDLVKELFSRMARITARFGYLGECPDDRVEMVFDALKAELTFAMSAFLSEREKGPSGKSQMRKVYDELRNICDGIRLMGDEEDDIITDLFDYFIICLGTGILMKSTCPMDDKAELLDSFLKELEIEIPIGTPAVFDNIRKNQQVREAFFSMANEWESPNYWCVLVASAERHDLHDESIRFIGRAIDFVNMAGGFFVSMMPDAVASYEVDEYRSDLLAGLGAFFDSLA